MITKHKSHKFVHQFSWHSYLSTSPSQLLILSSDFLGVWGFWNNWLYNSIRMGKVSKMYIRFNKIPQRWKSLYIIRSYCVGVGGWVLSINIKVKSAWPKNIGLLIISSELHRFDVYHFIQHTCKALKIRLNFWFQNVHNFGGGGGCRWGWGYGSE